MSWYSPGDHYEHPNGARVRIVGIHVSGHGPWTVAEVEVEHPSGRRERIPWLTMNAWRKVGSVSDEARRDGWTWRDEAPETERSTV